MIPYEAIPEEFRLADNKWNRLARHISEHGNSQVVLTPRKKFDPDNTWRQALDAWNRKEFSEIHRIAIMAWILASGFSDVKYSFDEE